jgi:hypothetical protein
MERPKHRRFLLFVCVLLAGGMAFALGRQWMSRPDPVPGSAQSSTLSRAEQSSGNIPSAATVEAIGANASAPSASPSDPNAATFRGMVIDAVTRQPVDEFEVHLNWVVPDTDTDTRIVPPPISKSFRSASGRFSWTGLKAGTWRPAITAPGYQPFNLAKLQLLPARATRDITMPLRRGYAVRGRIVEQSGGAAVVGAYVSFRPFGTEEDTSRHIPYAQSKADGSFFLDGLPGGDVILVVTDQQHAQRLVTITVDERTPPQEVALSTGGTIAGTVVTAKGTPVKALVSLIGAGMDGFGAESSETGQFVFEHLRAGRYRVSVTTEAGRTTHDVTLGEDEINQSVDLMLDAGRSIRGMLRGLPPKHLHRVQVVVRHVSKPGLIRAVIDPQGAYALNGVAPGNAVLTVSGPSLQFEKLVVVPADEDVTLDIDYPSGARISGRITQGGKPAGDKTVKMRAAAEKWEVLYRTTTSADGQYELEGVPPGDYFIRADKDIIRRITVVGDDVLNIDIPLVQLSAQVVEDGGAVPIVGASVYVRGSAPETAFILSGGETDDFGRFALTGIEPGEIVLTVYKPGYELHRQKMIYSAPSTNQTIALRKSDGVEVKMKPGKRPLPRGFTITQSVPGSEHAMDLWIPLERSGVSHVPSALIGTTFQIGRFGGEPIVIEHWDGQPFELQ